MREREREQLEDVNSFDGTKDAVDDKSGEGADHRRSFRLYLRRRPESPASRPGFIHKLGERDAYVSSETPLGDNSVRCTVDCKSI